MKLLFIVVICCLSVLMDTVVPCHQAASVTPEPPAALTSKTVVFQQSPVCSGMRRSHRHFRFVCLCTLWSQLVQHQRSRRFIRVYSNPPGDNVSSASIRAQQSHQKLKKAHGALLIGILRRCTAPVSPRQPAHPTLKKIFNLFSTISHGPGNTQSWHQHLNVDAQEQWDFNPVRAESRALPLAGMFLITFHRGDEPAAEKISSYMSLFLLMM